MESCEDSIRSHRGAELRRLVQSTSGTNEKKAVLKSFQELEAEGTAIFDDREAPRSLESILRP